MNRELKNMKMNIEGTYAKFRIKLASFPVPYEDLPFTITATYITHIGTECWDTSVPSH